MSLLQWEFPEEQRGNAEWKAVKKKLGTKQKAVFAALEAGVLASPANPNAGLAPLAWMSNDKDLKLLAHVTGRPFIVVNLPEAAAGVFGRIKACIVSCNFKDPSHFPQCIIKPDGSVDQWDLGIRKHGSANIEKAILLVYNAAHFNAIRPPVIEAETKGRLSSSSFEEVARRLRGPGDGGVLL